VAARPQHATKFGAGGRRFKPVKRLAGSNEIHARCRQAGRFGRAGYAMEMGIMSEGGFGCGAHLVVRFDGEDGVAVPQEKFGQQRCARAHVGHHGRGRQPNFPAQQRQQFVRVARPALAVECDAVGKATGWLQVNLIFLGALAAAFIMADEKETGALRALAVAPLRSIDYTLARGRFAMVLSLAAPVGLLPLLRQRMKLQG
jgi:hypothetical protein